MIADWQLLALFTSFATAAYIHVNNVFKVDGLVLVFLRGLALALTVWPILFFVELPQNISFYLYSIAVGACVVLGDKALFGAAAKHGARLTSLFISMKIFVVFAIWSLIQPAGFLALIASPTAIIGITVCYLAIVAAMIGLRRQDASFLAIIAIVPAAIFLGMADILTKLALTDIPLSQFILFFWVGQLSTVAVSGAMQWNLLKNKTAEVFTRHNIIGTAGVMVPFLFLITGFLLSVAKAPNPAYVGAITVLTTVWLTIFYKLTRGDNANMGSTAVIVLAALGLVFFTN